MGFYNKYILPKIINAGCGTKPIRKQREKVLPLCKIQSSTLIYYFTNLK